MDPFEKLCLVFLTVVALGYAAFYAWMKWRRK